MEQALGIGGAWLTVNRFCNFRCLWCYAKGAVYKKSDNLPFALAQCLVNLIAEIGATNIIILGGEPTFYEHLFPLVEYIARKGMTATLVTNGFLLGDDDFLERLRNSPISAIDISLKAGNAMQHRRLTGSSGFQRVLQGIRKSSDLSIPCSVSITINSLVLDNIDEMVKVAVDNGAKSVSLQFCSTTFENGVPNRGYMAAPRDIVDVIVEKFEVMSRYANERLYIAQSLPSCIWPENFLEMLEERKQVFYGCHVVRNEGIIFDPSGHVIPCNCLHEFPLGQYGRDFDDLESFSDFWKGKQVRDFYDKIIAYPSEKCMDCPKYDLCGGGCPLQWFIFDPAEIIARR